MRWTTGATADVQAAIERPSLTSGQRARGAGTLDGHVLGLSRRLDRVDVFRMRSAERRLVLACARRTAEPTEIRHLLRSDLDWGSLLLHVDRLGLAPLGYLTLTRLEGRPTAPGAVLDRLEVLYYRRAALNAHLFGELHKILTRFSRDGIAAVVLKGAAMAELVYQNIAARPMQDLDLLVRTSDLDAADRALHGLGYAPDESYRSVTWYQEQHHHLAPYAAADGRAVVEVHHQILPPWAPVRLPIEELWRRARPVRIASVPTLVLAPEDLLLHLALGMSCVDRFVGRLATLHDIAAVAERCGRDTDWARLLLLSRDCKADRFVYYPLWLARHVLRAEIPPSVLQSLGSSVRRPADLVLKILTQRALLAHDEDGAAVPAWILARACGDLLDARGLVSTVRALRPLDLLARALRRGARLRQDR
jgi:hypothetical protein